MLLTLQSVMQTLWYDMSKELRMSMGYTIPARRYCVTLVVGRGHGGRYRLRGVMQSVVE